MRTIFDAYYPRVVSAVLVKRVNSQGSLLYMGSLAFFLGGGSQIGKIGFQNTHLYFCRQILGSDLAT